MIYPERFDSLPDYAFPRLRGLLDAHEPGAEPLAMSIGEPRHPPPAWLAEEVAAGVEGFRRYPANDGTPELRAAIAGWIARRYGAEVDPETEVMALNGTREGLFNAALALLPEAKGGRPVVLMPNPFYQAYGVAPLVTGAEPVYVPATAATGFLPDYESLPAEVLDRTAIAYLCSPSNPQGAVASREDWARLIRLAERHDFRIFADECYSEIYDGTPPVGAIEVARELGADRERLVIFNSLSKRSNLPGLRSGFVAGGPRSIAAIRRLRAYAGAPCPGPLQRVAARAWSDEEHVDASRDLYVAKYRLADRHLAEIGQGAPAGGFFLWLPVDDGEAAALRLWRRWGVRVLPGAYLARDVAGLGATGADGATNPGHGYIRAALVADAEDIERGLAALGQDLHG